MKPFARSLLPDSRDERVGLFVAGGLHALLIAWMALKPVSVVLPTPPERMTVTLTDSVGLTSTSSKPSTEAAPDTAPQHGERPPSTKVEQNPKPQAPSKPLANPLAQRVDAIAPRQTPLATPKPAPVIGTKPARERMEAPASRIGSDFLKGITAPRLYSQAPRSATQPGGSRIGKGFLEGNPDGTSNRAAETATSAAFGPQQQSALRAAIFRQLKPHWVAPQGVDAEKLVTVVRFRLDQSGHLVGEPVLVEQSGQTPANVPQTLRHLEQAVRAIKLAQPFILPPDLYPYWQTVTSTFDKKLSQ